MASSHTDSHYMGGTLQVYDGVAHAMEWAAVADYTTPSFNAVQVGQLDADPALEIVVFGMGSY
jgi:hypothetical protein